MATTQTLDRVTTGASLASRYREVRAWTETLAEPLVTEDYVVSSMPDVSPTKWHLAHTSWFFETFVLAPNAPEYRPIDPKYAFLFNSYYVQAGERHCRAQRGLVTRPTVEEVYEYRAHVDRAMLDLLEGSPSEEIEKLVTLGLHHEQQHQELVLTDIKHVFWTNPMHPVYVPRGARANAKTPAAQWIEHEGGVVEIGHEGGGFSFDNEGPRHRQHLAPFRIASRLVTNGEYLEFMESHGYQRPEFWLSSGFDAVRANHWEAPLYWQRGEYGWEVFTLGGLLRLDLDEPVTHVSFFEADAFARWKGLRLPREAEWETVAGGKPFDGSFAESRRFHPTMSSWYGDVWQWTSSPYVAYPGYRPAPGAVGEYNGKWMCDQWVLRGASCATPRSHARLTYRNFFAAPTRWQFAGIRLAADA